MNVQQAQSNASDFRSDNVTSATTVNTVNNNVTASNGGYRFPSLEFGVPAESIAHIDVISESVQKRIWEMKDVNLASLLIPNMEVNKNIIQEQGTITVNLSNQEDLRLNKALSISEFITAFGKYKRVMCQKYPERRVELDRYEANIVEISNVYGSKFYDYHCQFSAKAAAAFRDLKIKVD